MLLKPLNNASAVSVMKASGIIPERALPQKTNHRKTRASELLDHVGFSDEQVVHELAQMARFGENETVKLGALKTCLEMHGMAEGENGEKGDIKIQIITNGDVNLLQMLCPSESF
jgi:hypothetical protein